MVLFRLTVRSDGAAPGRVTQHVGADMRVCNGRHAECRAGDQERSGISSLRALSSQEDDVTSHHQRRTQNNKDLPAVNLVTDGRQKHGEEGADDVGRHREELLGDG